MSRFNPNLYELGDRITFYKCDPCPNEISTKDPYKFVDQKKDMLIVAHYNPEVKQTPLQQETPGYPIQKLEIAS